LFTESAGYKKEVVNLIVRTLQHLNHVIDNYILVDNLSCGK